jgi:GNAT superfamily N-acetyltransferase
MSIGRQMAPEPATRVGVTVTFLRMERPPAAPAPDFPPGYRLVRLAACTVPYYRYLYNTVGADYVWWLRRTATDAELAALLASHGVSIHVLMHGDEPAGFFEIDGRQPPIVNLSYFGLMPHAVGHGVGTAFLRAAIDAAWLQDARLVTVNTCTADHPRALPAYLRAGFVRMRELHEIWDIPLRLGMKIPDRLRV